jgi:hypothetical protein
MALIKRRPKEIPYHIRRMQVDLQTAETDRDYYRAQRDRWKTENAELKLAVSVLQRELADAETRAAYFAAELVAIKEPLRGEIT